MIFGNITKDPEFKSLPSGIKVTSFSVATNRVWKDKNGAKQESADFHNVVVFGRQAEIASQYLKKGRSVFIEGRMQTRSWDAQDGTKKYRTEIIADRFQFGPQTTGQPSTTNQPEQQNTSNNTPKQEDDGMDTIDYPESESNLEDIPF